MPELVAVLPSFVPTSGPGTYGSSTAPPATPVLIAQHIQDVRRGPGSLCLWPYSLEEIYGKWPFDEHRESRGPLCLN
jgi:hypothetical protein